MSSILYICFIYLQIIMKLKEYLKEISRLKRAKLITDNTELCYASDDEWNSYSNVIMWPGLVSFNRAPDSFGITDSDTMVLDAPEKGQRIYNFLCIN